MKFKRGLLSVLAMVMVCAVSVAGTVAYLKTTSNSVVNTFSTAGLFNGDPDECFQLLETAVKFENGAYVRNTGASPVKEIKYEKLTPGMTLFKEPYISITEKSFVPAWLYIEVVEDGDAIFEDGAGSSHINTTYWTKLNGVTGKYGGVVYVAANTIDDNTPNIDKISIFSSGNTQFTVKEYQDGSIPGEYTLTFYAYMCQTTDGSKADAFTKVFLS